MKTLIAWCFIIAVLCDPVKSDDGISVGGIIGIAVGVGIIVIILLCCCLYYCCRCVWLCCNRDSGNNVTVVQQSSTAAPSQPVILTQTIPVGMGSVPAYDNTSSSRVDACGYDTYPSQEPRCSDSIPLVSPPPY